MRRLAVRACAASMLAGVLSVANARDAKIVHYDISGDTAGALRAQLDAKGPTDPDGLHSDAYTRWYVAWKYRYRPTASGCEFTSIKVSVSGTMTLPRWVDADAAPGALVADWDRYIAALRVHEDGHYAHGVEAARRIRALARSYAGRGGCAAFVDGFNRRARAVVARYERLDVRYDRETDHGRTQGAWFP